MKKGSQIVLVSITILIVIALLVFGVNSFSNSFPTTESTIKETKNQDCHVVEGYTWDSEIEACVKVWELNEEKKEAAKIAVDEIKELGQLINVIEIESEECDGCFNILLESENQETDINLVNWNVADKEQKIEEIMTEEICTSKEGRLVSIEDECSEDEMKIGNILDFINPSICCSLL